MAKEKYIVSAVYAKKDLLTIREGQHVNITGGAVPVKIDATKTSTPKEYTYRAGTEDDRKWFYEMNIVRDAKGNPIKNAAGNEVSLQKAIIKVNDNTTPDK